ncbi:MAG TPA: TetR/AcrR family transcriptional regulator [Mycobacteriales bacterium]|nr:TetR/AcrR family transcriptional regulator [Mycobacteriales bacterium]
MPPPAISRRASYGPNSPVVGARGARTRQQLLDVALAVFAERGFHATLVEDIAGAAGMSRAALYQYFESREQIAIELIEECGAALMRVVRRLGPLDATAAGYDNLHWWLGEWSYVYDKYATMFVQWAHIDSPKAALRPLIATYVENYTARLAQRLRDSDVAGLDPEQTAITLMTVVERVNYYRHTQGLPLSEQQLIDSLAVAVQRVLFPQTPLPVLVAMEHEGSTRRAPVAPDQATLVADPAPDPAPERFAHLTGAAATSVQRLLQAGAAVFAEYGFRDANVHQILLRAGLSRRTFYKYFANKQDMLGVLTERAETALAAVQHQFPVLARPAPDGTNLTAWIGAMLDFQDAYWGVFRCWLEEDADPVAVRAREASLRPLVEAFTTAIRAQPHPDALDPVAGAWILLALLERLPHQGVGTRYALGRQQLVDIITTFTARGLLAPPG